MKDEEYLVHKVKVWLRRARLPRFLHCFGPKMYELWQHIFALFMKYECGWSFRRTVKRLRSLGFVVASKSTLQRYAALLDLPMWQTLFKFTLGRATKIGCIDGTGLERSKASWHYIRRIDRLKPVKQAFKLSVLCGSNGKILNLRLRSKPVHDTKDVKYLFGTAEQKPSIILMDKGYDAEWIHEYFHEHGVRSIAPTRKRCRRGRHRKKLMKNFPQKLYNKRNVVESVFHAFKQKYGASVSSKNIKTARTETYIKAILHNLHLLINRLSGHTPVLRHYLIEILESKVSLLIQGS